MRNALHAADLKKGTLSVLQREPRPWMDMTFLTCSTSQGRTRSTAMQKVQEMRLRPVLMPVSPLPDATSLGIQRAHLGTHGWIADLRTDGGRSRSGKTCTRRCFSPSACSSGTTSSTPTSTRSRQTSRGPTSGASSLLRTSSTTSGSPRRTRRSPTAPITSASCSRNLPSDSVTSLEKVRR